MNQRLIDSTRMAEERLRDGLHRWTERCRRWKWWWSRAWPETLMCWLLVVAIGSALAALLVPNFIRARAQGRLTGCKSNLKNIGTALEMYSMDFGGRYPERLQRLIPNYLHVIPTCPLAGRDTYSDSYSSFTEPDGYRYCCAGDSHRHEGRPPNYPAYDAISGLQER